MRRRAVMTVHRWLAHPIPGVQLHFTTTHSSWIG